MAKYAHITDGQIDYETSHLPHGWHNGEVGPRDNTPDLSELKAHGWLPGTITEDAIDPSIQKLGDVQKIIEQDQVRYHRPAIAKTAEEQAEYQRHLARQHLEGRTLEIALTALYLARASAGPGAENTLHPKLKALLALADQQIDSI